MANTNLYFKFVDATSLAGKTGLTVTCNVFSVSKASATVATVATGASCAAVGGGLYVYNLSSPDFATYDYIATAVPSSTTGLANADSDSLQSDFSYTSIKPTTLGRSITVDASGFVTLTDASLTTAKLGTILMPSNVIQILGNAAPSASSGGILDVNIVNIRGTNSVGNAGYVGVDWAHLSGTSAGVNLSNTTVATVTNQLTAAAVATGVWQDTTTGDFTTSGSIGKSLFTSGATPGASGGLFIAGSNAATTLASITLTSGTIPADIQTIKTQTVTAAAGVTFPTSIASPTNITAGTITTVTNLTNAPTSGDFTATMKTSLNAATPASVSGSVGSVTGNVGGSVGSISGVTFPANFGVLSITASTGFVTLADGSLTTAKLGTILMPSNVTQILGTASAGAAGYVGIDWGHVNAPTSTVVLSGTTIATVTGQLSAATIAAAVRDVNNLTPAANSLGAAVNAGGGGGGSAPTVEDIDAQLSSTHGSGQWGSSSGSGAFTVTVTVSDGSSPVPNANVRVSSGITSYVATTNGSGVASFSLDAATWGLAITKSGYSFTPSTIVVSASANFNKTITPVVVPAPPSGSPYCNVYGYFQNLTVGNVRPIEITFTISATPSKSGKILVPDIVRGWIIGGQIMSAVGGTQYVSLVRNDSITPAATTYSVNCADIGFVNKTLTVAADTFDLSTLIT